MSTNHRGSRPALRVAPLLTSGIAIAGAGLFLLAPPGAPPALLTAQTHDVQLSASAGGIIGDFIGFFISNGTADHPNAGLLIGNGYSYTAFDTLPGGACAGPPFCNRPLTGIATIESGVR